MRVKILARVARDGGVTPWQRIVAATDNGPWSQPVRFSWARTSKAIASSSSLVRRDADFAIGCLAVTAVSGPSVLARARTL